MKKLCECEHPCGCGNNVVNVPVPCISPECSNPEKCSETYSSDCVIYTGDTIANLGITKGMPMSVVVQMLLNAIVNPTCIYPTSACISVVNVVTTSIGQTVVSLNWNNIITGGPSYQVEYRPVTSSTWTGNPITTNTFDTISGLIPNTDYYIRVKTICSSSSCYSLTIQIKTKTP